ncbi:MAG: AzlD domain-containing protein [Streptosporangiales bacterium]|nr:AzlD domain-containing protein [Streptosporangiales bacterium]
MTAVWITIAALFVGTIALKATGPIALRRRHPPRRAVAVIALVAPTVLTSLVLYQTLSAHPTGVTMDARIVGLVVAALAIAARAPMIVVILLAALATAAVRALA